MNIIIKRERREGKNMSFDLKEASEKVSGPVYQRPGISENVKISKAYLDKTLTNQVSYLQLETVGANGEIGKSSRMFLSTDKKEGKKSSAWAVTARNLTDLIMATHNVSEEEAQDMIKVDNTEQLVTKVSAILVGRVFRAKFKGVETAKGALIAELAGVESMKVDASETKLRYDANRDVVKFQGQRPMEAVPQAGNSDLPF